MSELTREEISRLLVLLHNTSGDCAGRDNIIGRKLEALTSKQGGVTVEQYAALCKGLELDPAVAGTVNPAQMEAIGAAIAEQAKRALCRKIYGVPGKGKEPTTNAELVEKIQARIQEFGGQVHPGTYQPELLALFRETMEALTSKDTVSVSRECLECLTESRRQINQYVGVLDSNDTCLNESLAALKQQEQSE